MTLLTLPESAQDIQFDGGFIHIIDRTLTLPPPISAAFGIGSTPVLDGVIEVANLTDTLDEAGAITFFAPSEGAFEAIEGFSNLKIGDLAKIVENHGESLAKHSA